MEQTAHANAMRRELEQKVKQNPFLQVSELIYRLFYDQVITLEWKPGTRLNETLLAKELEVSRSPVQEAILRLGDDGLVFKEKGRMAQVGTMDFCEYLQIGQLRRAVEGEAAYLAAKTITEEQLEQLWKSCQSDLNEFALPGGPARPSRAQTRNLIAFHRIIVEASCNQYLMRAFNLYAPRLIRYMYYTRTRHNLYSRNPGLFVNCHIAIFNALKAHYSSLAKHEIIEDVNAMLQVLHGFPAEMI